MIDVLWLLPLAPLTAMLLYARWRTNGERRIRLRGLGQAQSAGLDWRGGASRLTPLLASHGERQRLRARLDAAGWREDWQLDAFLLAKFALLLIVGVFALWWLEIRSMADLVRPGPMFKALLLLFLAVRVPDWLLGDRVRQRQLRIRAMAPQALDLLTICAEAGLGLDEALLRVANAIDHNAPEIANEFRTTRSELLVLPDRGEALKRLAQRSGVRELELLANSLIQSMRYGAPLVESLQVIASESRARQVSEQEEKAGAVAARIGIPLIVLVLFPLVVLMAAPPMISLIGTLSGGGRP
ncbi:type II secretion system F family protein [Jeongeupia wiesaeckerbachi]|uniref:type II secretion system F family protein n=1 Tax=Jeongeupia wiesaeckerbachi TaxID=3051218 RepID=UPI003D801415